MYWLKSYYIIKSKEDLDVLKKVFPSVQGECKITSVNSSDVYAKVEWCLHPFHYIEIIMAQENLNYPYRVEARLDGPQTVFCVAKPITEIDMKLFTSESYDMYSVMKWAEEIKDDIKFCKNHQTIWLADTIPTVSIRDIIRACFYANNVDRFIPMENGVLAMNADNTYFTFIGCTKIDYCSIRYFDIDDGFINWGKTPCTNTMYLNKYVKEWKNAGRAGRLCDYYKY